MIGEVSSINCEASIKDIIRDAGSEINELPEEFGEFSEVDEMLEEFDEFSEVDELPEEFGEYDLKKESEKVNSIKNIRESVENHENRNLKEVSNCPIEGHNGHWDGERGNSVWYPDKDEVPKNPQTNPDGLSWKEILEKYGIDGIQFENGFPNFSEIAKGEVEIEDFTDDRDLNFTQADEKLADKLGCEPEDVEKWRKENKYTWHECSDCKTMQLVPREVHGNISHSGGISVYKAQHNME